MSRKTVDLGPFFKIFSFPVQVPKATTSVNSWLDLEEDIPAMPVLNSLTKNRAPGPQGQRRPTKAAAAPAFTEATGGSDPDTLTADGSESDPIPRSFGSFLIANELAKDAEKRIKVRRSANRDDDDNGQEEEEKDIEAAMETLPSLTKGRVKTPKKRPPTRKKNKGVVDSSLVTAEVTDSKDVEAEDKHKSMPEIKPEDKPENRNVSHDGSEGEEAMKDIEAEVDTLPSLTKERVKTPKKRPPSRKKNKEVVEKSMVTAECTDPKDIELDDKPKAKPKTKPQANPVNRSPNEDGNGNEEDAMKDIEAGVETLPSLTKERVKTPKKRPPSRKNKRPGENSLSTTEVTDPKDVQPETKSETKAKIKPRVRPEEKPDNKPEGKQETSTSSIATGGTKMKGKADVKKGKRIVISRKRAATEEAQKQGSKKVPFFRTEIRVNTHV